jgi:hypothetical protein
MGIMNFPESHKKIERAYKHIRDLDLMVGAFGESDFYSIAIDYDPRQRINHLRFMIDTSNFKSDAAVITGDALHNLRSALDILYYQMVPTKLRTNWTRFPICDTREELESRWLNSAIKQKQIGSKLGGFIINTVKPYAAGNPLLWALDDLNVIDKHQLLIPALQSMLFDGIRLEDNEDGSIISIKPIFMDESGSIRLREFDYRKVTVKEKGHASAAVIFAIRVGAFEGEPIIPALTRIAEEVTRTVEAFESLDTSCFVV